MRPYATGQQMIGPASILVFGMVDQTFVPVKMVTEK